VGSVLDEIAQAALLFRGEFVDAREIDEAGASFFED
jgi:hypothetical protein